MNIVSKDELKKLIEHHFYKDFKKDNYEICPKKAIYLLTNTRFDLLFKLFYLEMKDKNEKLAKEIYLEHIRAFSLGKFTEPGNNEKKGKEKFIEDFNETFDSIKREGFNNKKTLIPLSKNGSIANGAHRVASAIFLDKNIECIKIETNDHIYDYKFFYDRGVSTEILDFMATKFVEYSNNVYITFLWPIEIKKDEEVEKIIPNIVYKKEIQLTPNGAKNLISQIYENEEWLGNRKNDFRGANAKVIECFKNFDKFNVYAFQAKNLDEVLEIKNKIRDIFKVGKHSVHITDTKEEALRVAKLVFNDNGIHFLNYAKPNKFLSTYKKIDNFKNFVNKNSLDFEDVIIDSSMILSLYGIREAKDIDFLYKNNTQIKKEFQNINPHDEELKYYKKEKKDIIYNHKNYFCFDGIKFVAFELLYQMKKNRNEEKDKNDYKMMEALIENNKTKEIITNIKQKILYFKIKLKQTIINILQFFGLFEIVRKFYKKIFR